MRVFPVAPNVNAIDLNLLGLDRYGAAYVVQGEEGAALVEVGTSLCVPHILAGLEALAIPLEQISHILLTHIHMDHAGAAGYLLEHLPRACVVAHSRSHRHLVDPARLRVGVKAAVGPLFPLYGQVRAIDPQRLLPAETFRLDLGGGARLEAVPTPGHSRDHVAYFAPIAGTLFVGDAAGVSLFEHSFLRPVTAPPHFSLEGTLASLETMRSLRPVALCFTHFGVRGDPRIVFDRLQEMLLRWDRLVRTEPLALVQETILAEQTPIPIRPPEELWRHLAEMNLRGFLQPYDLEPLERD